MEKRRSIDGRGRGPDGKWRKGKPKTGGRKRGVPNRATVAGKAMMALLLEGDEKLPEARERWAALLSDPDANIRIRAEMFVYSAVHGRPRQDDEPIRTEAPPPFIRVTFGDEDTDGTSPSGPHPLDGARVS